MFIYMYIHTCLQMYIHAYMCGSGCSVPYIIMSGDITFSVYLYETQCFVKAATDLHFAGVASFESLYVLHLGRSYRV